MKMTGNTILVTGGTSGIGRTLAEALHDRGNRVVVTGRRQALLDEIAAGRPGLAGLRLDLGDPASLPYLVDGVREDIPELNVLVANAGISAMEDLANGWDMSAAEAMVETNILGTLRVVGAFLPMLRRRPDATIMVTTSNLAFVPKARFPTYCATKAFLHSWLQSLRHQLRDLPVEVLELAPPYVRTALTGEHQASDPRGMPLDAYVAEVLHLLDAHDHPRGRGSGRARPRRAVGGSRWSLPGGVRRHERRLTGRPMSASATIVPLRLDRDLHCVAWLTLALFLSYLCIGMSLPVTSVYVIRGLGLGNAFAGLAAGVAFASTILTRGPAGRMADHRGSKHCMIHGLLVYAVAGLVCGGSAWPGLPTPVAYGVLVLGRLLFGVGESFALVGLLAWCCGIMPRRTGRVFTLVGMAVYGAFAVGSPIGVVLYDRAGFAGVMGACALVPLIWLAMVLPVAAVAVRTGERVSFWQIIGRIRGPGLALCLAGIGSAAIGAFMPLLFLQRGWSHVGLGLTCFGGAFVLARILFGHLPDRVGSIPVAIASTAVEAIGQCLLWTASGPAMAFAGAFLTGLGCSLMFPAMGMEVVRRIPPHLRGTATGGLAAFQDLAFGVTGPVTGLLADGFGYGIVFLVGALAASLGLAVIVAIARSIRHGRAA